MKKLPQSTAKRSRCPISTALDVFGDKWTLLLVRDIGIFRRHRYQDFLRGPEGIPSNILAARLKTMQSKGLVSRVQYQARPPRYEYRLTPAGEDLVPIAKAMAHWSATHVNGISIPNVAPKAASESPAAS